MDSDAILTMLQDVAAEVITPRFRALAADQVMEKNPGDLVTVADHEAEVVITKALQAAFPDAVIVGEEAVSAGELHLAALATAPPAQWFTVDPIDGTKNFVEGSPDHAVMVSELRGLDVVRTWIWQPAHQQAFVSETGAGAYRIDAAGRTRLVPLADVNPVAIQGRTSSLALQGRGFGDPESEQNIAPMGLSWACCGVDYPRLLEGQADFILYSSGMPWDHCPGVGLLAETGGTLLDLHGRAYHPLAPVTPIVAARSAQIGERSTPLLAQELIKN